MHLRGHHSDEDTGLDQIITLSDGHIAVGKRRVPIFQVDNNLVVLYSPFLPV